MTAAQRGELGAEACRGGATVMTEHQGRAIALVIQVPQSASGEGQVMGLHGGKLPCGYGVLRAGAGGFLVSQAMLGRSVGGRSAVSKPCRYRNSFQSPSQ